jgi:hypothetical protein
MILTTITTLIHQHHQLILKKYIYYIHMMNINSFALLF